jgi:hypothetical protein
MDDIFADTGSVPKTISVSLKTYRDLLIELGRSTVFDTPVANTSIKRDVSIQTVGGVVRVLYDKDMPEGMDYYFDDGAVEKARWLDQIAEDIILRGE